MPPRQKQPGFRSLCSYQGTQGVGQKSGAVRMDEMEEKIFSFLFSGKEEGPRRGYKNITFRATFGPETAAVSPS